MAAAGLNDDVGGTLEVQEELLEVSGSHCAKSESETYPITPDSLPPPCPKCEGSIPGEHDVDAAIEGAPERHEGEAPHHDGLAHGDFAEVAHVAAQVPRQVPAPPDGAVLTHGHDERDDGLRRSAPLHAHTATLALIAGCGS